MKYVRIEERTQSRVKEVMEELETKARVIVYSHEAMEIDKAVCQNIIRYTFKAIIKVVNDYKLADSAVSVWDNDTVNPANIDVTFLNELWDYRTQDYFIIKRKTRKDQLMNRIHGLVDYVYLLMENADRTAEERLAQETQNEEYVQPAWKRVVAEIDKRREAEKV